MSFYSKVIIRTHKRHTHKADQLPYMATKIVSKITIQTKSEYLVVFKCERLWQMIQFT